METSKKSSKLIFLIFVVIFSLNFNSCKVNDDVATFQDEMATLSEYLIENNITTTPTRTGLYYIELVEGTGEKAEDGDSITIKYTGRFLNGSIFDYGTFSFVLGNNEVISGFDEGVAFMKEGGTAQLIIPSNLAYGSTGQNAIPPYTTLLFNLEILEIDSP